MTGGLLGGMVVLAALMAAPAHADSGPPTARVELVAPHGFHMRALVSETVRGSVVNGQVCRDGGGTGANPSIVRSFRLHHPADDPAAPWTSLSRALRGNDFGCASFNLTLSPELAEGETLRLVAE